MSKVTTTPKFAQLILQNRPSSVKNDCHVSLEQVAIGLFGRYGARLFRNARVRVVASQGTVLQFRTGSQVIVGTCHHLETSLAVAEVHLALALTCGIFTDHRDFKVNNSVYSTSLGCEIDLQKLRDDVGISEGQYSSLSNRFPGFRMQPRPGSVPHRPGASKQTNLKMSVFGRGKIVVAGELYQGDAKRGLAASMADIMACEIQD